MKHQNSRSTRSNRTTHAINKGRTYPDQSRNLSNYLNTRLKTKSRSRLRKQTSTCPINHHDRNGSLINCMFCVTISLKMNYLCMNKSHVESYIYYKTYGRAAQHGRVYSAPEDSGRTFPLETQCRATMITR